MLGLCVKVCVIYVGHSSMYVLLLGAWGKC